MANSTKSRKAGLSIRFFSAKDLVKSFKSFKSFFAGLIIFFLILLSSGSTYAHAKEIDSTRDLSEVKLGSSTIFVVTGIHSISAIERAEIVHRRLDQVLHDRDSDPHKLKVIELPGGTPAIAIDDRNLVLLEVTGADAETYGLSQSKLAEKWMSTLRTRLLQLKPIYAKSGHHNVKVLSEQRILLLLLQISVLLIGALVLGELATRLGQPAVIGQIFAGVVLGHSGLGLIFPQFTELLFPPEQTQSYLLEVISWLGVIFLLMLAGLETDIDLIKKQGKPLIGASVLGIVVPFGMGALCSIWIPDSLLLDPERKYVFAFFLGTVFSVSSVPVIARLLMEMKLLRRNIGQMIIATALCHDLVGCLVLALVAAFAGAESMSPAKAIFVPVGTALFIIAMVIGRRWIFELLRWVHDTFRSDESLLTTVAIILLSGAAITHFIGVHVVLGAFAVGVVLAQSPIFGEKAAQPLKAVALGIFAPVFFAAAGLHVNLEVLFNPTLLSITVLITFMACASKILGNWVGAKWGGSTNWEALSVAFATNARGAVGVIVGILGFSMGIISLDFLSIIVIMSLVTTAIAPPLIRWSLGKVDLSSDEQARLQRQERRSVFNVRRVLVPTRGGNRSILPFGIASSLGQHHKVEVTAFHVTRPGEASDKSSGGDVFSAADFYASDKISLIKKRQESENTVESINQESTLGYDLIVMGASDESHEDSLFGEFVESVVRKTTCPIVIVRRGKGNCQWPPRNLLIASKGVRHSAQAAEVAVLVAGAYQATLTSLSVVQHRVGGAFWLTSQYRADLAGAEDIAAAVTSLGLNSGVSSSAVVRSGTDVAKEILSTIDSIDSDLILLSAATRTTQKLHLGNVIPKVWQDAPCAVAVLIVK